MRTGMPILKELKKHKLLLAYDPDTHVWIWSLLVSKQLSKAFQKVFEQALKLEAVLISSMSVWELGMLVEKNG